MFTKHTKHMDDDFTPSIHHHHNYYNNLDLSHISLTSVIMIEVLY